MGRPRIEWDDTQLRLIMSGIERCDRQFPRDNARFLDGAIDEVRVVTGRLYGVATYVRLLGVTAVTRRPGSTTIQKAIDRAQALAPAPTTLPHSEGTAASAFDVHTLRRAVEPVVRDALGPVHELLAQLLAARPLTIDSTGTMQAAEQAMHRGLGQAALEDAHARVQRLELENHRLSHQLGGSEARAAIAETRIAGLMEELNQTIATSAGGAEQLAKAAKQLEGTEQFLKAQNDAVRQQATAEAEGLRRQVKQLRENIDHLQIDNDQYRRVLVKQRGSPL